MKCPATIDNKYRVRGRLTPEGAISGLRDLLNECRFITTCEEGTRPSTATATKEVVELARQARTHFANVEAINRALCAQPFPDHPALEQLVNIVPGLYAFAKAEAEIARERAQQALMKDAGLS